MGIKKVNPLFIVFPFLILSLGMSCAPRKSASLQVERSVLQLMVEQALGDIESAYASKNKDDFLGFLDKDFVQKERFGSVLESYFLSVNNPHLHFVIDMVIADKDGINVRLHWFRKAVTSSGVLIKLQGSSQLLFKRYPQELRLKRILQENPFF